jgi:hypothetical protein
MLPHGLQYCEIMRNSSLVKANPENNPISAELQKPTSMGTLLQSRISRRKKNRIFRPIRIYIVKALDHESGDQLATLGEITMDKKSHATSPFKKELFLSFV